MCNDHEEADSKLALHCKLTSYSYDTVLFAIILFTRMQNITSEVILWKDTRPSTRLVDLKKMAQVLGPSFCRALVSLHAFTGCDVQAALVVRNRKEASI